LGDRLVNLVFAHDDAVPAPMEQLIDTQDFAGPGTEDDQNVHGPRFDRNGFLSCIVPQQTGFAVHEPVTEMEEFGPRQRYVICHQIVFKT
jgi:hypothetical protein